jgi:hypothetical protein
MRLSQCEAFVGRQRGPDFIPFEAQHSRKRIRHADIIVDDENARGFCRAGRHGTLWWATETAVKTDTVPQASALIGGRSP